MNVLMVGGKVQTQLIFDWRYYVRKAAYAYGVIWTVAIVISFCYIFMTALMNGVAHGTYGTHVYIDKLGEAWPEFVWIVVSIPFALYALKEAIKR